VASSTSKPDVDNSSGRSNAAAPIAAVHPYPPRRLWHALTTAERVLFVVFLLLGVYLLLELCQWCFAVSSGRDVTHPFAPYRFYARGSVDLWPDALKRLVNMLFGHIDESVIIS